jgi:hypothetical protein
MLLQFGMCVLFHCKCLPNSCPDISTVWTPVGEKQVTRAPRHLSVVTWPSCWHISVSARQAFQSYVRTCVCVCARGACICCWQCCYGQRRPPVSCKVWPAVTVFRTQWREVRLTGERVNDLFIYSFIHIVESQGTAPGNTVTSAPACLHILYVKPNYVYPWRTKPPATFKG